MWDNQEYSLVIPGCPTQARRVSVEYIYKTNRGWRTRPCIDASGQPNIHLSAGPVGPHEGGYWAGRSRRYTGRVRHPRLVVYLLYLRSFKLIYLL